MEVEMNEVIRTILSRRSTRLFKEDPLKDEELEQILEAAKYAPSGANQQPWNFTVVSNSVGLYQTPYGNNTMRLNIQLH